jgi:hypothetical protein
MKMPKGRKVTQDDDLAQIEAALAPYSNDHGRAIIEVRRRSDVSIRIRIIDPDFKRLDLVEREEELWPLLETLPEDVLTQITMLILVTPDEKETSFASMEFDDPAPWPEIPSTR